jgi:hypothetical protein
MENTPFGGFSASPHHQNRPVTVHRIPDSGGLAVIFARLGPAAVRYLACFAGLVMPPTNLDAPSPSIVAECNKLAVKYIHRTCRSFCLRQYAFAKKNEV